MPATTGSFCNHFLLGVIMDELDLVDEMAWEDSDKVEWLTLEQAGLEMQERDGVCGAQLAYYLEEGDH